MTIDWYSIAVRLKQQERPPCNGRPLVYGAV